jgi:hypothetical protein
MDPPNLSLPLLNETIDLQILSAITAATPALAASNGWAAAFGRELNASDDRRHFVPLSSAPDLLPVLEGKHLEPFRALTSHSSLGIAPASAARLLDARRTFARARIGYRNIASATNRTTLIAAMLPERVVTTHTVFCLKTPLPVAHQYCLLALLNSLVANYLVRLQVTTHVPAALMARLPVPRPAEDDDRTRELERFSRVLERHGAAAKRDAVVRVNTIAADLYGLTPSQYRHVVGTFPLLDEELRAACVQDYERLRAGITRPAVAGPRSPTA